MQVLGTEDLSHADVSRVSTEVLERPVRYVRHRTEDAEKSMIDFGMTPGMAEAATAMTLAKWTAWTTRLLLTVPLSLPQLCGNGARKSSNLL